MRSKVHSSSDASFIQFPRDSHTWPAPGLRRASINSFGYGGANAHIIMDDAYSYLHMRGLEGIHNTYTGNFSLDGRLLGHPCVPADSPQVSRATFALSSAELPESLNVKFGVWADNVEHGEGKEAKSQARLLVWSAADQEGIKRVYESYKTYFSDRSARSTTERQDFWDQLASTLGEHRTHLDWRVFTVLPQPSSLIPMNLDSHLSHAVRAQVNGASIGFIFTGQGAQWYAMGRELLVLQSFKTDLLKAETYLKSLGCTWSVLGKRTDTPNRSPNRAGRKKDLETFPLGLLLTLSAEEMRRPKTQSNIHRPDFSQTLCTVLQIALVNLLREFGVRPRAVTGHSSGEIAAA